MRVRPGRLRGPGAVVAGQALAEGAEVGSRGILAITPGATVIEPGHVIHVDFGISCMGLDGDWQKMTYLLRPEEENAPAGLVAAFANTVPKLAGPVVTALIMHLPRLDRIVPSSRGPGLDPTPPMRRPRTRRATSDRTRRPSVERMRARRPRPACLSDLADIDIEKPTDADVVSEIADEAIRTGDGAAAAAAMTALARYEKEQRIGRLARPVLRLLGPAARHLPYFRRFAS